MEVKDMKNDEKILELKKQIEKKKELLKKSKRFSPVTNCIIELDGQKQNIQAMSTNDLIFLATKLNSYYVSSMDLELDLKISGYNVKEWIDDILAKIATLNVKNEEKQLKAMEDKLTKLLSNDKKVELEINEIESLLNN
jgi:hypothetical protein